MAVACRGVAGVAEQNPRSAYGVRETSGEAKGETMTNPNDPAGGIKMREYFAGHPPFAGEPDNLEASAALAVAWADALIAALNAPVEPEPASAAIERLRAWLGRVAMLPGDTALWWSTGTAANRPDLMLGDLRELAKERP
jgi:hypothetical protein